MDATEATLAGRQEAEALMTTTVDIGRTEYVPDQNGVDVPTFVSHWTGRARIRQQTPNARQAESGAQLLAVQSLVLSVPISGTSDVKTGDIVKVLANPLDAALVDAEFTITGMAAQTYATARRFEIERTS